MRGWGSWTRVECACRGDGVSLEEHGLCGKVGVRGAAVLVTGGVFAEGMGVPGPARAVDVR